MANTKAAQKAIRTSSRKRVYNLRVKNKMKAAIKEVRELIAEGKIKEAKAKLPEAYSAIDKAAKKAKRHVIKKNTASRYKSRLTKAIDRAEKSRDT